MYPTIHDLFIFFSDFGMPMSFDWIVPIAYVLPKPQTNM